MCNVSYVGHAHTRARRCAHAHTHTHTHTHAQTHTHSQSLILICEDFTSDVNILAQVPMHQAMRGLLMRPSFMASTMQYSSTPPTCEVSIWKSMHDSAQKSILYEWVHCKMIPNQTNHLWFNPHCAKLHLGSKSGRNSTHCRKCFIVWEVQYPWEK